MHITISEKRMYLKKRGVYGNVLKKKWEKENNIIILQS